MDLPVIDPPVAPRWIWMEEVTYSHIPIAALITAFLVLAPILEWIGWRRGDQRFDRLAKSLVYFTMILYSPGAALGTGIPIFIIGFWPEFWHRWAVMFFWPLVLQFIFFLLDVAFLFFGYYLCWDRLKNNKPLHLFFGVMSALFGVLIQVVWDALGGYMTTTGGVEMPPISQPLGMSWAGFFNPSFPWLFFHRSFANISWAMLLTGGIFALKYWRQKDPEEKAYYGWASDLTFTIGVLAIFALPFIGWGFAGSMQGDAPVAFHAVMGGHISDLFLLKMILIAFVVILGGFYLFARQPSGLVKWSVTLGCAVFWLVLSWHPPLNWFGGPWAWRIAYTAGLGLVLAWFWLFKGRANPESTFWRWAMFGVGLAAFFAFCFGGFVRERARQPYSVYNQLVKPEVTVLEADRWLAYEKCIGCHLQSPKDFARKKPDSWAELVARERKEHQIAVTDEETVRIVKFLEENYR